MGNPLPLSGARRAARISGGGELLADLGVLSESGPGALGGRKASASSFKLQEEGRSLQLGQDGSHLRAVPRSDHAPRTSGPALGTTGSAPGREPEAPLEFSALLAPPPAPP